MVCQYLSNYYLPTRKEDPRDAEIVSHRLMVRAGMIRKLSSGVYSFLPLASRIQHKIDNIVREEMDRIGGLEVKLPIIQPRELWEKTGRWELYGPEMMRFKDRRGAEYGLGPTHEEVITDLLSYEVDSYRDCPLLFYQIATKFRDEVRPRFGIMRSREFSMKDAYSFHADEEDARKSYREVEAAYCRIFDRIGFDYRKVEAATGQIGGSLSHEFMVLADTGEDLILYCDSCSYAANQEKAEGTVVMPEEEPARELEKFPTPGVKTIDDLIKIDSEALPERQVKTLVYRSGDRPLVLLLPGNYQLNEAAVEEQAGGPLSEYSEAEIKQLMGAYPGSLGAVKQDAAIKNLQVWADPSLKGRSNLYTGANIDGYHYRGVDVGRDLKIDRWCQLRVSIAGEQCGRCGNGKLQEQRGIEVGHIFYLGDRYSRSLDADITMDDGQKKPMIMGCYGIGTSRIMAAAIEQSHDDNGIIWPRSIAPFDIYILPISWANDQQRKQAEEFARIFEKQGYEVLVDDRDVSPGVKFNDSELIGIPLRITLGRALEQGLVELTDRATGSTREIPVEQCLEQVEVYLTENGG